MKLWLILTLGVACAFARTVEQDAVGSPQEVPHFYPSEPLSITSSERNFLINQLISSMFTFIRYVINNGSPLFGLPPLDPLYVENIHVDVPAGLVNLDLQVAGGVARGMGSFRVVRSTLALPALTFDLEITVPQFVISCDSYDLLGDLFTAIPLYGKGDAEFVIENFTFRAFLHLKQSEDELSIILDRIENPGFEIPTIHSRISGAIGGGDIDAIVNAIISEVFKDYVNRFSGIVSKVLAAEGVDVLNPYLNQLDTWKYIRRFV